MFFCFVFLSQSSSEARTSRDHFFLSPDFHDLWPNVISTSLFTEVKQYVSTGMGDHFSAVLMCLMALRLALVD